MRFAFRGAALFLKALPAGRQPPPAEFQTAAAQASAIANLHRGDHPMGRLSYNRRREGQNTASTSQQAKHFPRFPRPMGMEFPTKVFDFQGFRNGSELLPPLFP